ncbi:MAG: TRAP transporter small permease [Alphaproteobacteria bacterium]|nr:TRAP transporter small permease [Alphaproteobacteria bacterium]
MQHLTAVLNRTTYALAAVSGIGLFALASMVTTDVLVRKTTGRPILGVFEFAEIFLVAITFLAMPMVQFAGRQLKVDILATRLRGRPAAVVRLIEVVATGVMFSVLAWSCGHEWLKAHAGGFLRRGMIEIPTTILLSFILIGTVLMLVVLVRELIAALTDLVTGHDLPPPQDALAVET